jgi:hypothetical protein
MKRIYINNSRINYYCMLSLKKLQRSVCRLGYRTKKYVYNKKTVSTLGLWRDLTFNYISYFAGGKVFLDCSGRRKTIQKKAATFHNWSILVGPPSPSALLSSVHNRSKECSSKLRRSAQAVVESQQPASEAAVFMCTDGNQLGFCNSCWRRLADFAILPVIQALRFVFQAIVSD